MQMLNIGNKSDTKAKNLWFFLQFSGLHWFVIDNDLVSCQISLFIPPIVLVDLIFHIEGRPQIPYFVIFCVRFIITKHILIQIVMN